MKLVKLVNRFCKEESGASMVEYGVALLVVAAIGATAMTTLGGAISTNLTAACTAIGVTC